MYGVPSAYRPPEVAEPRSLAGYSGFLDQTNLVPKDAPVPAGIPAGTEVILGRVECPRIGYPVLEELYYDGDASGGGYLHFRVVQNGVTLSSWWADRRSAVGQAGAPQKVAVNLMPGSAVEIRCKNEHPTDGTLKAYCDGTVAFYEKRI